MPRRWRASRRLRLALLPAVLIAATSATKVDAAAASFGGMAWGSNALGQLGDGTTTDVDVPTSVTKLSGVTAVAAGGFHSMALVQNGTVMTWGGGLYGEPGDGSTANKPTPEVVGGVTGVTAIAAGAYHDLVLLSDGTVRGWGANNAGQLATGSSTGPNQCGEVPRQLHWSCSTTPVSVGGLKGVTAIAAGGDHSLALLSDGTVMAWGKNQFGQLGVGTTTGPSTCSKEACATTPVAVSGLSGVAAVAAGELMSYAIVAGGEVESWGNNKHGSLGDGTTVTRDVPVAVSGIRGVTAVAAGGGHAVALLGNGTVMTWGSNNMGQLGNGTTVDSDVPVAVGGLAGVVAIGAGRNDSFALLANGTVMGWGNNRYGKLGNGATSGPNTCNGEPCSTTPIAAHGLRQAHGVAAGFFHTLAFGEPLPAVTGLSPTAGPTAGGTSVTITGTRLGEVLEVSFGGVRAPSFTVDSSTSITATSPAEGQGTVDVTVSNAAGTSPPSRADEFSYGPPQITKISPRKGPATGGTTVTITGTAFTGATAVRFGNVPATSYRVLSARSITAVAPAHAPAAVDVTVETPLGTSPTSASDRYKYVPAITSLSPSSGPAAGGTTVTVTGSGFTAGASATTFRFGSAKASSVNCTSSTRCSATSPPHAVGAVDVTATTAGMTSAKDPSADRFLYE